VDRLQDRKYIILISSGRDTFSKLNFDHVLGSYRKIKVELADGDGHPLKIRDQKGKDVK